MRTPITSIRDPVSRLNGRLALTVYALLLVFGVMLASRPVASEEPAGLPHEVMVKILDERYGEASMAFGIAGNGVLIELFTTPDGTTWTMVLTFPNGRSVVVATGQDWTPNAPIAGRSS